ncbi:MAG: hypothetical protein E6K78_08090 [Candidatus Eisenbacteria bacterium]|uniref:Tetratricopeptide repeat protein n=1 Tax=Eiseniibacteriota bacterium TaxID=2212470 RepID=A0A538TNC9_UNCEI|nr:MAG: hypothetical protein E6K78_08090 [Candidatus Eisenbacteria bacterium]
MAKAKRRQAQAAPGAPASVPTHAPPFPSRDEIILTLLAAACVLLAATTRIYETDVWQHLAVGRAIWTTHAIPTLQVWSWPTYGTIDTTSSYSWLFRFLVYPWWAALGELGLLLWRWATTLAAFGLLWKAARVLGARGPWLALTLVACALVYHQRAQVRPETLAAVWLAAVLLVLEQCRAGQRGRSPWLVGLLWVWVNTHVSYVLGFLLVGIYALFDRPAASRGEPRGRGLPLWAIGIAAAAVSFVNPYGWRALWQPFAYVLQQRNEPIYRAIGELLPFDLRWNRWNGAPFLLALWPVLLVMRARQRRFDAVEAVICVAFTAQAVLSGRFLGFWALVAVPFLARGLSEWHLAHRPQARAAPAWACAAVLAVLYVGELSRRDVSFGYRIVPTSVPVRACDFIAAHGIRGRAFNSFEFGGYMLWRFWPDRGRLPFLDIHQAGSPVERQTYMEAHANRDGWLALNQRYRPDFVLTRRFGATGDSLKDFADADAAWALVFADDVAAVYVRRAGAPVGLVDRFTYHILPAGSAGLAKVRAGFADPAFRAALRADLDRQIAASPFHATASSFRATLDLTEGRLDLAEADLEEAHAVDPRIAYYAERRGAIAELKHDWRAALSWYLRQRRVGAEPDLDLRIARAYRALGDARRAARFYRGLLKGPFAAEAADSLRALGEPGP